ncbi:MAG TPA: mercuric reductase [Cyanobacteria bacterium UBA8803]|nr:mercuric reductase [Cyanobacteria bacterium UBA9273]HBL62046.1 mercuric reductase [Cyanobacteria bacterium UBA8803]
MTVEYDLIVIGGSKAGTYAALAAAHLQARVALIEPQRDQINWLGQGALYNRAMAHVSSVLQQVRHASPLGISFPAHDSTKSQPVPSLQLDEAMQWAQAVVSTCSELLAPTVLASVGVDVIIGDGEFCRLPHLGFVVNNRRLRSRSYLIGTGSRPHIPDIDGLDSVGYLTPAQIWQEERWSEREKSTSASSQFPVNWVVIGGGAQGTELAQTLARLNYQVTLVVSESHILPQEDPEASRLIQAQLEAEGIRVLTQSPVTQVRAIEDKKWVQAGNRAIEADEIVLAVSQQPHIESLNLEGVGVKFSPGGLELNDKLQTTNPRIYACGDVAGGYHLAHVAQYEVGIALKNALFAPLFKVDYRGIPRTIFTDPQLARVGIGEGQARRYHGKDVWVLRQYFKTLEQAQLWEATTGFCKLVVRRNGEILGASVVGQQASELIGAIALAMRYKIKISAIADLPQVSPTWSEVLQKTALEWQRQRLSRNKTLQNFLEGFFNLRRDWSS